MAPPPKPPQSTQTPGFTLEDPVVIGRNHHWQFVVGRIDVHWVGAALGDLPNGDRYLHLFHNVSTDFHLGVTDRALAIRRTCACALDPEGGFGGIDEWFIPETERGSLADLPPEVTDGMDDYYPEDPA